MSSTIFGLITLFCAAQALAQEQGKIDAELLQPQETDERVSVQILLAFQPHAEIMGRVRLAAQRRADDAAAALKRLDVARASRQEFEAASRQVDAIELEVRQQGSAEIVSRMGPVIDRVEADIVALGGSAVQRWPVLGVMQADIPRRALRTLGASADVARVSPTKTYQPMLDKSVPLLGAPSWWNNATSYTGVGQSVAVIDSGVAANHPAFQGLSITATASGAAVASNACFSDNLTNANDISGHGTHVTGIIASRGMKDYENHKGVAPGLSNLFFYKVFFSSATPPAFTASCPSSLNSSTDVNTALTAVVTQTAARIVNMSLGAGERTVGYPSAAQTIDNLMDISNAIFVIAAGNLSTLQNANPPKYTSTDKVCTVIDYARAYNGLTVARANKRGETDADSCRGTENGRKKPDLAAPGTSIYSTNWQWQTKNNSAFIPMSGTSMAAPHIAGALALLGQAGITDPRAARALLINTAAPYNGEGPDGYESAPGFGYADLTAALSQRNNGITGTIASEETKYWVGPGPGLLTATLTWNKHSSAPLSELDLYAFDVRTGEQRKAELGSGNNVKRLMVASSSDILLRVTARKFTFGSQEPFALALSGAGFRSIPTPTLNITCTDPAQTLRRNSVVEVDCTAENPSAVAVPNVSIGFGASAPAGFRSNVVFVPVFAAGQKTAYRVTVFLDDIAGVHTLPIEISSPSYTGMSAKASVTVNVEGRKIKLQTDPPNLQLTVDGQTVQTPFETQWLEGSRHRVEAATQTDGGTRYQFAHWSDGWILAANMWEVQDRDETITATFRSQYQLTVRGVPDTVPVGTLSLRTLQPSPDGFYDAGTVALAYATIGNGQDVSWTGEFNATSAPEQVEVIMDRPKTIVATVGVPVRVLSFPSGGKVTIDGISYTTPAMVIRTPGLTVTLAPEDITEPDRRLRFQSWDDGVAGARTVAVPAAGATHVMNFQAQYRLQVDIPPQEARLGQVVVANAAADGFYDAGSLVPIEAKANAGSAFIGWTGDTSGAQNPLLVTMDRPQHLTARFALPQTTVIDTIPSGQPVFVDGERFIAPHTVEWATGSRHLVQIGIVEINGSERLTFEKWSDGGASFHTVTAGPETALLVGTLKRQFRIEATVLPERSTISQIVFSPNAVWFDAGSTVDLGLSDANDGWAFQNWGGALSGTVRQQRLVVDGPKSVVAVFAIPVIFESQPAGRQIIVDGQSFVTPKSLAWPDIGFHNVDVPAIQNGSGGERFVFREWINAGTSPSRPVTATPGLPTQVARFDVQVPLQLSGAGQGSTVVADTPGDSGYYNLGTEVRITAATSLPGLTFVRFEGDIDAAQAQQSSIAVRMDRPRAVRAVFRQNVQFTTNVPGSQVVVDGQTYAAPYLTAWEVGSRHEIAIPNQEAAAGTRLGFASWSDGGAIRHEVTATAGVSHYVAALTTQYRLEAAALPAVLGQLLLSPASADGFYAAGTRVQIIAEARGAGMLASWAGDFTPTTQGIEVVMNAPRTVVGNFDLGVTIGADPGEGLIVVDNVTYRGTRLFQWQVGSAHTIAVPMQPLLGTTQTPVDGTRLEFLGWSDNGGVSHGAVASPATTRYTASFLRRHQLSLATAPGGTVSVTPASPDGFYNEGTEIQLRAESSDATFRAWHGDWNGTANPISFHMTGSKRIAPDFGASAPPRILALLNPAVGTALSTTSADFSWLAVPGASVYSLTIGSQPDRNDIFDRTTSETTFQVPILPCDGRLMWVRLNARVEGTWMEQRMYLFQAVKSCQ